ncbi:cysteine hydrolase family protein [Planococcus lenghuensis]|uniref:Isochorismatase n=1 Tax=Planococcus lenghuensis TaxID=2213202 RepID=A0A1Q2KW65_9BACL|nr:isochorismatase family cysteine hydrolase [Planococcus lenghuensis]AQQ51912.1 isochorismatase [Planococcus lenghuensis]
MKKSLLNIDYTYDFVADDGKLTCGKPGQAIEGEIVRLTDEFQRNGDYIVFAVDGHDEEDNFHPENSLFPPHNINGTAGRELYGSLKDWYERHRQNPDVYWMDKTRYSAFAGTNLEMKLRERGIEELWLVGVCTDICILHTAVDAYNKGFKIVVPELAVASFNPDGHVVALNHFRTSLGADVR